MKLNNSFEELRTVINDCQQIVIAGHQNPDGDAIGSCLALGKSLHQMGKKVFVLLEAYGSMYDMIPGRDLIVSNTADYRKLNPELFIALDCGDTERLGEAIQVFDRAPTKMNIDHHISNCYFGDYNFVEGDASSASELVYRLIRDEMPLDKEIATALYAGILYDTGGFRHTSTSPATMTAVAELMTYQIPFNKVYRDFFDKKRFQELKIIGRAFDNAKRMFHDKLIYSTISASEFKEFDCTSKDVGSVVSQLKGVEGAGLACFLYEKAPNVIKVSFRCEEDYDVCELALQFGGGGHKRAAGGTINEPLEKAVESVLKAIEKII